MTLHLRLIAPVLISLAAFACSGGDQEEKSEEPAATDGEEEPEAPDAEASTDDEPAPIPPAASTVDPLSAVAAPPPAPVEPAGFDGAKVTRYVKTFAVNVRSAPDKTAPVVRHHKRGDKLDVILNGDWAKLNSGEYVSTKVLVESLAEATKGAKVDHKAKPRKGAK